MQALVDERPHCTELGVHALAAHLNLRHEGLWQRDPAPTLGVLWQAGDLQVRLGEMLNRFGNGNASQPKLSAGPSGQLRHSNDALWTPFSTEGIIS